jgi:uncharacterized protein YegJ (DUF2314 family)
MTYSEPSKVVFAGRNEDAMQRAFASARESFRYFWRELAWERRRIVPGLDFAYVKAAFSDGGEVEHMWLSDIEFDGQYVSGVLLNTPRHVDARKGDPARVLPSLISDWMFGSSGQVYGAYTVQAMRARMRADERRDHDQAWGLDFGDPSTVRVFLKPSRAGLLKGLFGKGSPDTDEHPMSAGMAVRLREELARDPTMVTVKDERGWTMLHDDALAGNLEMVRVLLEGGADRAAVTGHGMTAAQLAAVLGWTKVVALLEQPV